MEQEKGSSISLALGLQPWVAAPRCNASSPTPTSFPAQTYDHLYTQCFKISKGDVFSYLLWRFAGGRQGGKLRGLHTEMPQSSRALFHLGDEIHTWRMRSRSQSTEHPPAMSSDSCCGFKVGRFMRVCDIETIMFDALLPMVEKPSCLQSAPPPFDYVRCFNYSSPLIITSSGLTKSLDRLRKSISPTKLAVSYFIVSACHHCSPARRLLFSSKKSPNETPHPFW